MRKNIISLILATLIAISVFTFSAVAENETGTVQQKSIEFVKTFNIIKPDDNGNFNETNTVTRGELAQIICSIFSLSANNGADWYEEMFKESNANVSLDEVSAEEQLFSDLKNTHEYYPYIKTACELGILQGNGNNEFFPDRNVTYEQFNKVIVGILGYSVKAEAKGGYPYGYNFVANELKLTSGVKGSGSKEITRRDMALMIFNAIDVEVMSITSVTNDGYKYEPKNGETLLNVMGMKKLVGQLTANSVTNLYDSSELNKNTVRIGNEIFKLNETTALLGDYIGREIEAYATNDDENTFQTVLLYFLTNKDNALTVDIEDVKSYAGNTVVYEENGNEKRVSIKNGAKMIRNGSVETIYDNSSFNFECGNVTFVSSDNSKSYDLIIINGYDSVYVSQWNSKDKIMHDKFKGSVIAYDFNKYDEEKIEVYKKGELVTLEDISTDDILDICAGKNSIRVYISDNKIKDFCISNIETTDGVTSYSDGMASYKATKKFVDYPDRKQELVGSSGTLYLNKFNKVVWFSEGTGGGKKLAYLNASKAGKGLENTVRVQIYDYDSGKILDLPLKSKVEIDTHDGKKLKKASSDIYSTYLSVYGKGIIKYELSKDNEISYIELPINVSGVKGETGRLYDIGKIKNMTLTDQEIFSYHIGYNAIAFINSTDTMSIKIPVDEENSNDEAYYGKGKGTSVFSTSEKYDFQIYTTDPDTIFADVIVAKGSAGVSKLNEYKNFAVVKEITTVYKDDVQAKKITLSTVPTQDMTTLKDFVVYAKEDGGINKAGEKCYYSDCATDIITSTDQSGKVREYTLEKGDIIFQSSDENGYLNATPIVVYKANMYNPYVSESEHGKKGWFAGTAATWPENEATDITNGNPLVWNTSDGVLTWAKGKSYSAGGYRIAFGYPVWYKNGTYKLTTQDLSNGNKFNEEKANIGFRTRDYFLSSNGCTINIENDKVTVSKISASDLKTNEYYGSDCSQVINMISYGGLKTTIIINRD